jgi:hypothetical protein
MLTPQNLVELSYYHVVEVRALVTDTSLCNSRCVLPVNNTMNNHSVICLVTKNKFKKMREMVFQDENVRKLVSFLGK